MLLMCLTKSKKNEAAVTGIRSVSKHGVRTMHSAPNGKVCALRRTRKCAANFDMSIWMGLTN